MVVDSAVEIADRLSLSNGVVGLTLVALSTSLPELATTAVAVLRSSDRWFGMTYPEDHASVVAALADLTERGVYPRNIASIADTA